MKKNIALIYWIFKTDKKQTTPYLSTCLIVTLLFVLNIVTLLLLFGVPLSLSPFYFTKNQKINSWLNTIIAGTFLWIIFGLAFPKSKLEKYEFENNKIVSSRKWLILYVGLSILLMTLSLIKQGINKGTIHI